MINLQKPSIFIAIKNTFLSLTHPKIIFHMLWPVILGFVIWIVFYFVLWYFLKPLAQPYLQEMEINMPRWIVNIGLAGFLLIGLQIVLAIILMPIIYLTFVIILSLFSIPLTLPTIIVKYFPNLEAKNGIGFWKSINATLIASLVFIIFFIASFSLFFIPFAILIAHLICTAFLNKATFLVDALSTHGTAEELQQVKDKFAPQLFFLGLGNAALTYLPIINIFAPAIAALSFIHYGLSALEFIREEQISKTEILEVDGN